MSEKPHILLVDDEPRFIDSLENILSHYGYVCTKALNGTEAVTLLQQRRFDLALLDVVLPDMSGCDIAGYIKGLCRETTVVMLTGIRTVETAVEAMKQGAYDFLTKPLNHDLLLKTLEKGLEHARLKQELASSEQKFRLLSEAAWEGVALHEGGRIIEANRSFLDMFGYSQEDVKAGLELVSLLGPEISTLLTDSGQGQGVTATVDGWRKDGGKVPVEARFREMQYQNRPAKVLVVQDLTERLRAEREKLELQQKLAEANKLNALGLMAGSVAHDLNNILTGIVSYPDLLLMQMDKSDKHYEQISKIQAAGKRAAAVVSDLVAITRGRTQQKTVESLNDLVMHYLNSLEHGERLGQFPGVVLQTSLRKDLANICCSPQHLHKVLLNLVGNAMEAVERDGLVRIQTENCLFRHPLRNGQQPEGDQEFVKLTVADNGPGIAEKDINHIFDPFYSTKVMGKSGTGLGLSVVWNIIQDHNGWVEVRSDGPGAVFEVYLPSTRDEVCSLDLPCTELVGRGNGERILIVDDQAEQNDILESGLVDLGYTTYSVTSGEAAIDFLKSEAVDLLLVDMIMGDGLNGRETLEIILQDNPSQRAIVVSGFAKREEIEKTKALGISLFMEKPVTLARINTAIQQSLARN